MTAIFKHGEYLAVDHAPSGATTAGTVVVVASVPYVFHVDAAAGEMVGVAATGGVYKGVANAALAAGVAVGYDTATGKFGTGGNPHFGWLSPDSSAAADGDPVVVIHQPNGGTVT